MSNNQTFRVLLDIRELHVYIIQDVYAFVKEIIVILIFFYLHLTGTKRQVLQQFDNEILYFIH